FHLLIPPAPRPPLFPYTTLFRSGGHGADVVGRLYTDGRRELHDGVENGVDQRPEGDARNHLGGTRGHYLWDRARRHAAERVVERSEEHTSELQSQSNLVCRLLLE